MILDFVARRLAVPIRSALKRGVLTLLMLSVVWLVSCRSQPDFEEPPEIIYGEHACDRCLMIINEARFAAAYVTTDGETRRFDDIGGMLAFANEQGEEVAVFWVHDYETEAWLKAEEAAYVLNDDLITPMGFGVIAFTTEQQAVAWSNEEGGMVMTFEELREASSSAGMEAGHDHEPNHLSETGSVQGSGG